MGEQCFTAGTYGRRGLDRVSLDSGARQRLYEPPQEPQAAGDPLTRLLLHDWSRDGRFALCDITRFHQEISVVTLAEGRRQVVIRSSGQLDQARFSPDGRWVTYNDRESGRFEIFVVPFPPTGERFKISTSGGVQPEWRGNGRELFYVDPLGTLMAVDIRPTLRFEADSPHPLFRTRLQRNFETEEYRVTADGQRFLLRVPVGGSVRTTLVLNWWLLKQ